MDETVYSYEYGRENEARFWFSKRFFVAVMMFFGTINTFALSANLNIAIVEMTSPKTTTLHNETIVHAPEFDWDSRTKGLILGAFSYGIAASIFGGYLAMKFGGSTIIGAGVAITAIITIFNPSIIRYSFHLFLIARAIEGVVEGFAIVSFTELWTQWAPVQDRSRLMAIGFSGMYAGTAIAYPVCGFIMHEYGWPAAFYLTGGSALIWSILWILLIPNSPSSDKCISQKELKYIINNQISREPPKNVWRLCMSMLRSKCVLALCTTKFTYGVGFSIVVTCFPMYIKDMTNAEIHKVGIFSSLPNIISAFTVPIVGYIADYLHNKNILNITQIHKLFMCGAFVLGAVLLFIISSISANFIASMICFMLFKIALSTNYVISQ
ncbi:vesicular glutamate transporter 3-like isoform X2 [Planococcus citri]